MREVSIDQRKKYFTAFTSFEKARDYEVCSYVVMLENKGTKNDRITIGKFDNYLIYLYLVTMNAFKIMACTALMSLLSLLYFI